MVYCNPTEVYDICGMTSDDVSSSAMTKIILSAVARVNADINLQIREEEAKYIDQYRTNLVDGSNAVFYVQDSYKYFIGDFNNDGTVSTSDVEVYVYSPSAKTKTAATVSAVDWKLGKITLSAAPASSTTVSITYARAPLDESTPHRLVKEACRALAASLAYMKIRAEDYQKLDLGDFSVTAYAGGQSKNSPFGLFASVYEELIEKINSGELISSDYIPDLPYLKDTDYERP